MSETRKIAAILVSDIVGYRRLAGVPPTRARRQAHGRRHYHRVPQRGRRVRCAIEMQNGVNQR